MAQAPEPPWPRVFLPSEIGPEPVVQSMIENYPDIVAALATELHRTNEAIVLALDSVVGADSHDYLRGISAALTLDEGGSIEGRRPHLAIAGR
jgi:hypothetical protein